MSRPIAKIVPSFSDTTPPRRPLTPSPLHPFTPSLLLTIASLILALLLPVGGLAQKNQRPKLLPLSRNDFAGKVILVPRDERILELRTLGQIADHYLVLPPSRLLDPKPQAEPIIAWLKEQSFAGASGAVISLETLAGGSTGDAIQQRLQTIKQIRSGQPKLQIYGFATLDSSAETTRQTCQTAIELVADGTLDYLLIAQKEDLSAKPAQIARARLIGDASSRQILERVGFDDDPEVAAPTLLARLLARRLGWSPKILPIYSSAEGRRSDKGLDTIPLDQSIVAKIAYTGGSMLQKTSDAPPMPDVLLYVYTPESTEEQRTAFTTSILQTADKGARVAVVDLSETKQSKQALMEELRRLKLLGKLAGYASSLPSDAAAAHTREAANRALAQVTIFFAAMKSLRDDIDRVHRMDRAQVNLIFSRFLEDWAYDLTVRPQLEEFVKEKLQADPNKLGEEQAERAEKFAFAALKLIADELFDEQFRRSTHAILMNSGSRAQFRISLLQRLQIRFPSQKTSEAEIRQTVHTFYEGMLDFTR